MYKKLILILSLVSIIFLAGCVGETTVVTRYVCPDGTIANSSIYCPEPEPKITENITETIEEEPAEEVECQYGGIKILEETIKCDFAGSADYLSFTVENSGSANLYNLTTQIYVNDMTYAYNTYEASTGLNFTEDYLLQPNERKTVVVDITNDLPSQDADWIRIITRCPGVVDEVKNVDCYMSGENAKIFDLKEEEISNFKHFQLTGSVKDYSKPLEELKIKINNQLIYSKIPSLVDLNEVFEKDLFGNKLSLKTKDNTILFSFEKEAFYKIEDAFLYVFYDDFSRPIFLGDLSIKYPLRTKCAGVYISIDSVTSDKIEYSNPTTETITSINFTASDDTTFPGVSSLSSGTSTSTSWVRGTNTSVTALGLCQDSIVVQGKCASGQACWG